MQMDGKLAGKPLLLADFLQLAVLGLLLKAALRQFLLFTEAHRLSVS